MNDDLIEAVSSLANGLKEATEQVREVIERFAKAVSSVVDVIAREVLEAEPPELPKKKHWTPVKVLGCKPNTAACRKRVYRAQRRGG